MSKTTASTDRAEIILMTLWLLTALGRVISSWGLLDSLFAVLGFSFVLYYSMRLFLSFRQWKYLKLEVTLSALGFAFCAWMALGITGLHIFLPTSEPLLQPVPWVLGSLLGVSLAYYLVKREKAPQRWKSWGKVQFSRLLGWALILFISLMVGWNGWFQTYYPDRFGKYEQKEAFHKNGAKAYQGFLYNGKPDSNWYYFSENGDTLGVRKY
jgi:hypothetical protein